MSWKTSTARLFGFLRAKDQRDGDLAEELRSHIEIETDDNVERGMAPEEARRAALLKFGNPQLALEDARQMWSLPSLESVLGDLKFGWRVLWKAPGFAIVAVLTLALGIGATTAIFSVAYGVLIRPLPYADPQQLVLLHQFNKAKDAGNWRTTPFDYLDWRERARSFSGIAAYTGTGMVFSGRGAAEMVLGQRVSYNLFHVLGVQPALGRGFRYEEEERGRDRVIVLSHGLWLRMFGGDPGVVGRDITLNNETFTVVGVMPRGFAFPDPQYQAWVPQPLRGSVDPQWVNRSSHFLRSVGRLKAGVSFADADREMKQIAADLERQYPNTDINEGARIQSLTESVVGDVRTSLTLLLGAAACLLLIACANIANLLLARGTAREREIAIRQALGAGNRRIFRQLLTENLVLALLGAIVGCGLAYGLVVAVVKLGPRDLPRLSEIHVDATALVFAFVVAVATGLFFGLAPLASLRRHCTAESLKSGEKGTSSGPGLQRLRAVLVTGEIAICGVLLIVAGLTVRSLMRLDAVDPGFNPDHAVTFNFVMMEQPFPAGPQLRAFTHRLLDELQTIPGLERVGFTSSVPLSGNSWANPATVEGSTESPLIGVRAISAGYFEAMQTPMRRGRAFTRSDSETSERVAIVNESTARKLFDGDAIGRHIKLGNPDSTDAWRTVVGVVADVHERGLDIDPDPSLFVPYDQLGDPVTAMAGRGLYVVMRTADDPANAVGFARSRMTEINSSVPMHNVQLLREMVSESIAQPRFRTWLFAGFGLLALLLASVGLYGVLSYAVAQRTREFGIRIALGARRADLWKLVFGQGSRLVGVGLALALVAALGVRQIVRTMLFGVSSADPVTFIAVLLLVAAIAAFAMLVPARRAMNADPLTAIRYE